MTTPADGAEVTITAVIPVYNREKLIERCIASITAQTVPVNEIIVVDDGSADSSAQVAEAIPGVTVVRQANGGAGSARSAGLRAATSTWVAFLDSDDGWTSDHIERIRDAIVATGGTAAVYFDDTTRGGSEGGGSHWANAGFRVSGHHELADDGADWMMLPLQPAMLQSSVVDRATAVDIGAFRTGLFSRDDTDFFFRIGIGRRVCAVAGVGAVMTDDADQRLGERTTRKTHNYWVATTRMYEWVLGVSTLSAVHRVTVRRRLATAHLRMMGGSLRARRFRDAARCCVRAFRIDARVAAVGILDIARRRSVVA